MEVSSAYERRLSPALTEGVSAPCFRRRSDVGPTGLGARFRPELQVEHCLRGRQIPVSFRPRWQCSGNGGRRRLSWRNRGSQRDSTAGQMKCR